MTKRTINVLCLIGCALLIFETQAKARAAQEAADAARARSREATERARRARDKAEKARKAQEELDRANEEQRNSPGPTYYDKP